MSQHHPARRRNHRTTLLALTLSVFLWPGNLRPNDTEASVVEEVVAEQADENDRSATIQARINEISDDTDAMAVQYRASLQNLKQLEVYNRQLEALIASQEAEAESLHEQIDEITVIGRQVMPHMETLIATLERFVELDTPFLLDERRERVAGLRDIMKRADVTISERYRRILEAYQIESEFGRTIEATRGSLNTNGEARTVDFLRIGRIALLYQTLDGQESGVWNPTSRAWETIEGYRVPLREGLRMARKQRAPDLIEIPVQAPEVLR